jgi:phosphate transport system protein
MDKLHLDQHISHQFNKELEDIRNKVLTMGGLVEQQVTNGLIARSGQRSGHSSGYTRL